MRVLVFLLVVANLLFFAWAQGYFGESGSPDAVRLTQQLQPENLRIVSRGEPPAPGAEAEGLKKMAAQNVDKCLVWSGLSTAEADRIGVLLSEKFAALKTTRRVSSDAASWWVFIPPLPGKQEADRKAAELKRLAVPEFFVVQEGANRYAISLGIFSSEAAANERLAELRAKGVKSARADVRTKKAAPATFEAQGSEALVNAARDAAALLMPEARPALCGSSA